MNAVLTQGFNTQALQIHAYRYFNILPQQSLQAQTIAAGHRCLTETSQGHSLFKFRRRNALLILHE